jgi:hypothetical protein
VHVEEERLDLSEIRTPELLAVMIHHRGEEYTLILVAYGHAGVN